MKVSNRRKPTKADQLEAYKGKTFVTIDGEEYQRDYEKRGRIYIIILIYKGRRMQIKESELKQHSIRQLINSIKDHIEQVKDMEAEELAKQAISADE